MIGIVIVTHGNLAKEFITALEHVVGPQEKILGGCIHPEDNMDKRREEIINSINDVNSGDGVIVTTDMFGGTPSNLAISTIEDGKTEVIAGVNLPMLIKMASSRKELNLDDLVKVSQDSGRKYINVASTFFEDKSN